MHWNSFGVVLDPATNAGRVSGANFSVVSLPVWHQRTWKRVRVVCAPQATESRQSDIQGRMSRRVSKRPGAEIIEPTLRNKISRGNFTAVFFLQCLAALGGERENREQGSGVRQSNQH